MSKFKTGDKVKVLDSAEAESLIGKVLTVDEYDYDYNKYRLLYNGYFPRWFSESDLELYKEPTLIEIIAEKLGVEVGEEFEIDVDGFQEEVYILDIDNGLALKHNNGYFRNSAYLSEIVTGKFKIKKLPKAPRLSEQEYWVLKGLKDYKYLTRDNVGDMNVQKNVSENIGDDWDYMCLYNHLFKFIKKDQEPHNIQELIKEYEEFNENN